MELCECRYCGDESLEIPIICETCLGKLEDRNKQLEAVAEAAKAHIDESECIGNVDTNDNCGWCSWCLLRKAALDALKGVHDGRN